MDTAFTLYISHVAIDALGATFMAWWIISLIRAEQKVSVFYVCLLLMFIGGIISSGGSAYCRYFYIIDDVKTYKHILGTYYWDSRIVLNLVADGIATFILIHRYFHIKDNGK